MDAHIHFGNWTVSRVAGGWQAVNFISAVVIFGPKDEGLDLLRRRCQAVGDQPLKRRKVRA